MAGAAEAAKETAAGATRRGEAERAAVGAAAAASGWGPSASLPVYLSVRLSVSRSRSRSRSRSLSLSLPHSPSRTRRRAAGLPLPPTISVARARRRGAPQRRLGLARLSNLVDMQEDDGQVVACRQPLQRRVVKAFERGGMAQPQQLACVVDGTVSLEQLRRAEHRGRWREGRTCAAATGRERRRRR
eukprot:5218784-Prymnesium_polylepis.2